MIFTFYRTRISLGTVDITLENLPVGAEYILFQKSNGTYMLVVWSVAPVYNPPTKLDLPFSPSNVFFSF